LESKIHYDKLNVEAKAYNSPIQLRHDTFGDVIRYNRPRMERVTKDFDHQLLLGLEYLTCSETEEEKTSLRIHNADKRALPAPV
jgi:hypothetical protein